MTDTGDADGWHHPDRCHPAPAGRAVELESIGVPPHRRGSRELGMGHGQVVTRLKIEEFGFFWDEYILSMFDFAPGIEACQATPYSCSMYINLVMFTLK